MSAKDAEEARSEDGPCETTQKIATKTAKA